MIRTYHQLASCAPSQHEDVYIFATTPVTDRALAAITSADELLILNRDRLSSSDVVRVPNVPKRLTSLVVSDEGTTVICAGGDGVVAVFDVRTQSRVAQLMTGILVVPPFNWDVTDSSSHLPGKPVNALACKVHDVALGSDAVVSVWYAHPPCLTFTAAACAITNG